MKLEVDGADLRYDRRGDGPVVIQAHGLMSSRANDVAMGMDFSPLTTGHTLVRYDARGHGASSGRALPSDYTWPNLATDLLALRSAVAGDEPVDAIGASMGTATILHAAVREPGAFRRLVLTIPPTAWETRAAQSTAYEDGAIAVEKHGLKPFLAVLQTSMPPPVLAELDLTIIPQVGEGLMPAVLRGAALSDLPSAEALARLEHPVLLLPWAGDPGHPESTANALAEILPNATLELATSLADVRGWGDRTVDFLS